ncbi:MAG: IclR family transcriptional regulator, partial [Xanthobacteraceae bacterium]
MTDDRVTGEHGEIRCVGRALDLLEIMQRAAPAGIRVADAAAQLGVDPATASRMLATLISRGYASRTPSRRYTLGARSLRLATGWVDRLMLLAATPMARIANSCGETVYLLQLVGTEAVTVAQLAGNRRAMIAGEVGPSYPLWATAAGRALLGSLPRTQAPTLLPPEPFPAFTPRTKTTWAEVSAAIAEGRRNGMYAEEGEIDPFLNCCAAPLQHGEHEEKLALAVSFEAGRPERDRRAIAQALR